MTSIASFILGCSPVETSPSVERPRISGESRGRFGSEQVESDQQRLTRLNTAQSNIPQPKTEPPLKTSTLSLEKPPSLPGLISGETPPPDQDQLKEATENWFYGPGIGRTITNVGTVVAFPPYALYLIGNAGLSLAGLEQVFLSDLLPEKPRDYFLQFYNGVTSVPGRLTSFAAGRDYNIQTNGEQDTRLVATQDLKKTTQ